MSGTELSSTEQRLAGLERRLRAVEDELAITRLVLSYGPLADSGSAEATAELWEPDGSYDADALLMEGREAIAAMVRSPAHQNWISHGCAHFVGAPRVSLAGDEAVAVCYSLMIVCDEATAGFKVHRATANHWKLRRGADGWRVTTRTNRVLDGRPEAPGLLGREFQADTWA